MILKIIINCFRFTRKWGWDIIKFKRKGVSSICCSREQKKASECFSKDIIQIFVMVTSKDWFSVGFLDTSGIRREISVNLFEELALERK